MIQKIRTRKVLLWKNENRDFYADLAIITAMYEFHPLRDFAGLENELKDMNYHGGILFDLLAVNGLSDNRFCSGFTSGFDGRIIFESVLNNYDMKTFKDVIDEQNSILRSDRDFLLTTVLSLKEVEEFIKG